MIEVTRRGGPFNLLLPVANGILYVKRNGLPEVIETAIVCLEYNTSTYLVPYLPRLATFLRQNQLVVSLWMIFWNLV